MPDEHGRSHVDAAGVDAAIARVLQAERDAGEAVRRCARDAEALVEQAHELARAIARRAAERGVRVQHGAAAALQRRLAELTAQQARLRDASIPADAPARLRCAVRVLAAQLTGDDR
jgi:hypothetical protein